MTWRFADVEKLAVTYLTAATGTRAVTDLPTNLDAVLPIIRVSRGPGSDDGITDSPLLDVETFAANRGAASSLAEDVRDAMRGLTGHAVGDALVDSANTATGPTFVAYSPSVRRFVASYRLDLRAR